MTETNKEQNSHFKVLLVEDDPSIQLLMKICLRKAGFNFDLVGNGQEALESFAQGTYDLVLMDINMPIMDGHEATQMIRQFETKYQRDQTTIIALTANVTEEDRQKCMQSGCNDALAKPANIKIFINTLKQIAEKILLEKVSV